jgi:hypothetical protein
MYTMTLVVISFHRTLDHTDTYWVEKGIGQVVGYRPRLVAVVKEVGCGANGTNALESVQNYSPRSLGTN